MDNFISVKPSLELQKFIDSYYFHSCENLEGILKYTYYPHIKHAVTIYINSVAQTEGNVTIVKPKESSFSVLYSTVRDHPHQVEIRGNFKKIGIVFKPYGLNHFVKRPIQEIHNKTISEFEEWNPNFLKLTGKIWKTKEIKKRVQLLDSFFSNQKTANTNKEFFEIIDKINNSEKVESVQNISSHFNLSRKALYRMFVKELDCTPSKFLKILRFRRSLEAYLQKEEVNLTEAAVAQFYDQSNFIKAVKQITAVTPRKLTKEISDLDNKIFWSIK